MKVSIINYLRNIKFLDKLLKWFNVRYFLYRNGPFPMLPWPCHKIEYNIQLCLAGLNEVDRYVYNCLKRSKFIYNKTLKKKEILSWMWNGYDHLKNNDIANLSHNLCTFFCICVINLINFYIYFNRIGGVMVSILLHRVW